MVGGPGPLLQKARPPRQGPFVTSSLKKKKQEILVVVLLLSSVTLARGAWGDSPPSISDSSAGRGL